MLSCPFSDMAASVPTQPVTCFIDQLDRDDHHSHRTYKNFCLIPLKQRYSLLFFFLNKQDWWKFHSWYQICLGETAYIYPNPPPKAGCDTRSILKQCTNGLNLVFLLLHGMPNHRTQSALLSCHS